MIYIIWYFYMSRIEVLGLVGLLRYMKGALYYIRNILYVVL